MVRWRKVPAIDAFLEGVAANERVQVAALAVFDETGKLLTAKASPNHIPFDLEAAFAEKREDLMRGLSVHYGTGDHFVVLAPPGSARTTASSVSSPSPGAWKGSMRT